MSQRGGGAAAAPMRPAAWGALFKEPYLENDRRATLIYQLQARLPRPSQCEPHIATGRSVAFVWRRQGSVTRPCACSAGVRCRPRRHSLLPSQGFFRSEAGWPFLAGLEVHPDNAASLRVGCSNRCACGKTRRVHLADRSDCIEAHPV